MKLSKKLITLLIAVIFGLVLILIPVTSQVLPAQAAITWTKYSFNPVLEEGSTGEWDEGGVGAACVIRDGSTYKMWYTGLHVSPWPEIGYATSNDGTSWTKYGANPVLTKGDPGDWDDEGVGSCSVIWDADDSLYKMWYTGTPDSTSSAIPAIGYATSNDGISWVKPGSNPVLQGDAGEWDEAGVLSPCVIKEGPGSYKMWYSGRAVDSSIGSLQIGYATSTDGISWTKSGSNPVLTKGTDPSWDSRGVGVGSVVKISGNYKMWFTGYKGYGEAEIEVAIGYASSSDGISWTKSGSNPVLTKGTGWEVNGVGAPWVTYSSRTYRMWYSGLDTNFDPTLGYAYYTVPSPPGPLPDTKAPRISNILVSNITKTSADISWITNERSDSQVEYWFNGSKLSELDETRVLEHLVLLTNLTPATTYHFKVRSRDKAGNKAVSDEHTFTTKGEPATFTTADLTITPGEVNIGENVTISVSVANTGDLAGSHKVTLKIDNVVASTYPITLAAGASREVSFTTFKDVAATYAVNVDGLIGTFVVKPAPTPPAPTPPAPTPPPPVPPLPPPLNWWLIGGITAACVIIISVIAWLAVIRRRA